MVWLAKWLGAAARKISAKNRRPSSATGPAMAEACDWETERVETVAVVAMVFSFEESEFRLICETGPAAAKAAADSERLHGAAKAAPFQDGHVFPDSFVQGRRTNASAA